MAFKIPTLEERVAEYRKRVDLLCVEDDDLTEDNLSEEPVTEEKLVEAAEPPDTEATPPSTEESPQVSVESVTAEVIPLANYRPVQVIPQEEVTPVQEEPEDTGVSGYTEEEIQEQLDSLRDKLTDHDLGLIENYLRNDRWISSIRNNPQLTPIGAKRRQRLTTDPNARGDRSE